MHDLPADNLSKVQDFIKQQRKELDKYYRLHSFRKLSVVGNPTKRKDKTPTKLPEAANGKGI